MKTIISALIMSLFLFSCVEGKPASLNRPNAPAAGGPAYSAGPQEGIALPARLSSEDLAALLAAHGGTVLLLDVRTAEEYAAGHIPGALLAPYDALAATFTEADKNRPIVLYCRSGNRSGIAMRTLRSMGYTNLSDFGGIPNWKGGLER
jgi:rhodanese-related sulfurtransferase